MGKGRKPWPIDPLCALVGKEIKVVHLDDALAPRVIRLVSEDGSEAVIEVGGGTLRITTCHASGREPD